MNNETLNSVYEAFFSSVYTLHKFLKHYQILRITPLFLQLDFLTATGACTDKMASQRYNELGVDHGKVHRLLTSSTTGKYFLQKRI